MHFENEVSKNFKNLETSGAWSDQEHIQNSELDGEVGAAK